ncbi:hypothetical protein [Parapedobacter lycopersici]|uniref:hypothetical protein n=1 Tax=Parapedobacter lycopersici TaxID=1864939 RepID=UPI00333EFE50
MDCNSLVFSFWPFFTNVSERGTANVVSSSWIDYEINSTALFLFKCRVHLVGRLFCGFHPQCHQYRIRSTDGSALTEYDYSGVRGNEFRYVLIPAGVTLTGMRPASDIDWNRVSYAEAKQLLGLSG